MRFEGSRRTAGVRQVQVAERGLWRYRGFVRDGRSPGRWLAADLSVSLVIRYTYHFVAILLLAGRARSRLLSNTSGFRPH